MSSTSAAHRRTPTAAAVRCAAASTVQTLENRRLFATFTVQSDAFVRDGSFADTNFGAADVLFTKNAADDTREAYLKFDLSSASTIGTAILRMDAKTQSASTDDQRVAVFAVSDTAWVEGNGDTSNASGDGNDTDNSPANEITFANRPDTASAPIDIITISGDQEQGYAFDVTNYVRAEKTAGHSKVAFVVRSFDVGTDYVSYVSGEAGQFGPTLDVTSDTGPAATAAAVADITPPGGTGTDVTITYTDTDQVEFLSISPDDLLVLGPDGQPLSVTSATPSGNGSAASLSVTYTIAAPGGSWDDADAGAYSVRLASGQVTDALENVAPPGVLTTFNVGSVTPPPGEGPAATFASGAVTDGAATHTFTVTYADPDNVVRASIDTSDVTVTGPGGALAVTDVSVQPDADGASLVATYTVAAPGGTWDVADNGTYTVSLAASQVFDAGDNAAAAAQLGTFSVDLSDGGSGGETRQLIGSFGSGTPNPKGIIFTDVDGTLVTVSLKIGQGQVFLENGAYGLVMTSTTGASALSIKTKGGDGRVKIGDSSATGGLKSITGKTADLVGQFTSGAPLGKATLGNVVGGSMLISSGGQVSLTLGDVTNFRITSDSPIKSIKANTWADDGEADVITTADFGSLTVKGNFGADIESATNVKSVKVGGALTGSTIRATGVIGKVTAAAMSSSRVLAGVADNGAALPESLADFTSASAAISGVTIKGTFSDSVISAPSIGKAALGTVQTANNGVSFGLVADRIASLAASNAALGTLRRSKLEETSQSLAAEDFIVHLL